MSNLPREPNSGPYVVYYTVGDVVCCVEQECPTWADACALMRSLLLAGREEVRVRFA